LRYKIGDVSKILGISPDLMRYYEKKGIVRPCKDSTNDYRYYEAWDVNFLIECLWFKNFGFSMKKISKIVSDCSADELNSLLKDKKDEIAEEIRHKQMILERLERQIHSLETAKKAIGICDVQDSPEMVRYLNRYNFLYDDNPDVQALGRRWLKYIPFTRRCFYIEEHDLYNLGNDYAWGFSMDMEYVHKLAIKTEPPVVYQPPRKSVHSVFKQPGKNNFSPRLLDYMVHFAQENHLKLCGYAFGHLLCSVRENGQLVGYFEAWLPFEE